MSELRLHVLYCGHGDTLLLQMPRGKWGLIDCHLPGKESRERFFQYVDSLGIKTLDYVILTHPDSDHYRGMRQVLEYFSQNGRKLGVYCDAGASPVHVAKLIEARGAAPDDISEYVELIKTVLNFQQRGTLTRQVLHDQTATVRISGTRKGLSLTAVGPDFNQLALSADSALLGDPKGLLTVNECSVVLVAQFVTAFVARRLFLAGDMEGDGMRKALSRWDIHPDNTGRIRTFDVIKAPHHGSRNGHDILLADRIARRDKSVLVISCGTSYDLPCRNVVSDYLDRDWKVYSTSSRQLKTRRQNAMQATHAKGKNRAMTSNNSKHDLVVKISGFGSFSTSPKDARIERNQLNAYV